MSGCSTLGSLLRVAVPLAAGKLPFACLAEGTRVDTPSGPRAIERLEAGDQVIGYADTPVRILQKHCYLESPATLFLRIGFDDGAEVELCGMHRLAGIRARNLRLDQVVAGRKIIRIGSRSGVTRSFDLLTEDPGYRIAGVPVNSMIEEMHTAAATGMRSVRD
ncbi:MAG: Hint domain-containing protein [Akkermansiaceae bacterium]|nr:Hint domain-containing protein [Akkermansiaceae bacterium]MCF7731075.1 Hint domain-containing protein [Akkermansiaceae bacterium]